jgi:hypothetical protein
MNKIITLSVIVLLVGCQNGGTLDCIDQQKKTRNIGVMCVDVYDPVCGCDRVTYSNSCLANKAGVTRYIQGACPENCIDEQKAIRNIGTMCIEIYAPVCGCDGVTYPNRCWADKAGITRYANGRCPENCIDQQKKLQNIGIMCFETYDPVCGCNGVTYANSCWADKAGVTDYVKGVCAN